MLFISFWFYFVSCRDRFKFLFLPYSDSRANLEKYAGVSSDSDVFAAIIAKKNTVQILKINSHINKYHFHVSVFISTVDRKSVV